MRVRSFVAVGVAGLVFGLALPAAAENAAHDLANRFSDANTKSSDDARRKAYEAEMLERARQEAAERARSDLEAERAAEGRALADKLKRAEEARQAKGVGDAQTSAGETTFKPALTNKDMVAKPETDAARGPVIVRPPVEKPAVAREAAPPPTVPSAPPAAIPPPVAPPEVAQEPARVLPPPMALGRPNLPAAAAKAPADPRVTILLVMEPGKKGIRRFNKTADPVICDGQTCFVSNGADEKVRAMPMRKALGPGNTFGKRAGACRGKLACVFRGVVLEGAAPAIQPVDLKVLVHDRREPRVVTGDRSCQMLAGQLSCGRTVVAPNYRAWIVPERVAEEAGAQALEAAVRRGLVARSLREAAVRR